MNFSSGCRDSSGVKPLSLGGIVAGISAQPRLPWVSGPAGASAVPAAFLRQAGSPHGAGGLSRAGTALGPARQSQPRAAPRAQQGGTIPLSRRKGWVPRVAPAGSCSPHKAAARSRGCRGQGATPARPSGDTPCQSVLAVGGRKLGLGSVLSPLWISLSRARGHLRWSRPWGSAGG